MNKYDLVRYTRGRGIQVGGEERLFPHFVYVESVNLKLFADGVWDFAVVMEESEPADIRNQYAPGIAPDIQARRVVKPGGYVLSPDGSVWPPQPPRKPGKRAAVVRYGGIGDMVQASSVIAGLHRQGYLVTLYTYELGAEILRHDPNVDEFYVVDADQVPNADLIHFWTHEQKKYDHWVNLSESVEGSLLAIPGRSPYYWPHDVRRARLNGNYLELMHDIAGLPHRFEQRFYPTGEELLWAREQKRGYAIAWSLSGSSQHKRWPWTDQIVARLLLSYPMAHIYFMGDVLCQILEAGWENEPRVHCTSGKWNIRESLSFIQGADMVIGSETGMLNAAGFLPMPKVIMLSHSSEQNLTRHWLNTFALKPKTKCFPCHQLHYSWDHCYRAPEPHEGASLCQYDIGVEQAWQAVTRMIMCPKTELAVA